MFRRLLSRFLGPRDDAEGDGESADDEESEDSGFLPSRLDASVLHAHGMGRGGAEREIASVQEKANVLEEEHRNE